MGEQKPALAGLANVERAHYLPAKYHMIVDSIFRRCDIVSGKHEQNSALHALSRAYMTPSAPFFVS
jgi:hypothetical protein